MRLLWLLTTLLLCTVGISSGVDTSSGTVTEFRTLLPSEWGVPHPAGVSYSLDQDHLFLLDKRTSDQAPAENTTVAVITAYEDWMSTLSLEFPVDNRINATFDDGGDRLLVLNNELAELAQIQIGADGILDPATLVRVDVAHLGLQTIEGMDVDVQSSRLFLLDSATLHVVSANLDAEFGLESTVDLSHLGVPDLRGLAVHPTSGNLFVASPASQMLYELTQSGQLVESYDLDSLDLIDSRALDFGPSADRTDPPRTMHLFIADSNLPDSRPPATMIYLPLIAQWHRSAGSVSGGNESSVPAEGAPVFGRVLEVALHRGSTQTTTAQVASSSDDAEERHDGNRSIDLDSTDLELIRDGDLDQTVGIRFADVALPAGATIVSASIEFDTDEADSGSTSLVIHGEATDDALPFAVAGRNISNRSLTAASVSWPDIPAWTIIHETHKTPDLSPIVQEIVDRSGWRSGNAMAFIISGSGSRTAEAYDGEPARAPRLVVEFVAPPTTLTPTATPMQTDAPTPTLPPTSTPSSGIVRLAVVGDYGNDRSNEARVARLVNGWNPDFVITTGDNNYPDGEAATIDDNIGQYYSQFIGNYQGSYGPGNPSNRFWPALGNHDWHTITCAGNTCSGAYFDYFTLPNNERYYEKDLGLVHLFAIDSDGDEPDGRDQNSIQAGWLQNQLASSTSCYDLVYFHHPPYSSGRHGSNRTMQWTFSNWGADAVFSGHDHLYERLAVSGIPYFVNGAGGAGLYNFENLGNLPPEAASIVRYNEDHGAMLVTATSTGITYQFYNADGVLIDDYSVSKNCAGATHAPRPTRTPTPTATPTNTPPNTATPTKLPTGTPEANSPHIIDVPGDAPTIQAAIDLAGDSDVVLVAPGQYDENIQISGKTITLASWFYTTQDASYIDQTIIDGGGNTVIEVKSSVGPGTKIIGLTIQDGDDGINASAKLHIRNNRFLGNRDAIDYEAGGGICRDNLFENNTDDAIDLDGPTEVTAEDNIIRGSGDDGIEIRLHEYSGPTLNIIIRRNIISGNGTDGIQLVDHPGESDRVFLIERNLIENSAMVGLGLMDQGESREDFRGADIADRIHLFNNTFVNNDYGLTGGDNLIALNNIFVGSPNIALKNVDGNSIAAYNLFWGNGTDYQNSNVDTANTVLANPRLDSNDRLSSGSPAIDAGTPSFVWNSETVLDLQPNGYSGVAPDLGAYETQVEIPITNPQPPSTLLPPGTTALSLMVQSSETTTCAFSMGTAVPYDEMTTFDQGAGTTVHQTTLSNLDPDPNVVNNIYVRCASHPDYVLPLKYRSLSQANPPYPRIGKLWGWWDLLGKGLRYMARIDLWLAAADATVDQIRQLRLLNPDMLILTNINAVDGTNLPDDYYLRDIHGNRLEVWPHSYRLNLTKPSVAEYQARYAYQRMLDSDLMFDGVFFDNVFTTQSWRKSDIHGNRFLVDADENGIQDAPDAFDAAWKAGVFHELETFRALMPHAVMSGHSMNIYEPGIADIFNGISIGFRTADVLEGEMTFADLWDGYQAWHELAQQPRVTMIESSPPDQIAYGYDYSPWDRIPPSTLEFARTYYPYVRFGLALTLMNAGYFTHEFGDTWHGNDWWYDELDFKLGYPLGPAERVDLGVPPGEDQIVNGGFEAAIRDPWRFRVNEAEGNIATVSRDTMDKAVGAASARIDVTAASGVGWHIHLSQYNRSLEKSAIYDVSFWARSDSRRRITLGAQKGNPDWRNYGLQRSVFIDTEWKEYTISFAANETANDARILFQVGETSGTVWLDDVRMAVRPPSLYQREFTNGMVLLNGSQEPQEITVGLGYRRLQGQQAPRYETILDNGEAGFSTTGNWTSVKYDSGEWQATGPFYHCWKETCHERRGAQGEARWDLEIQATDIYTITAWWPAAPQAYTWNQNVTYEVVAGEEVVASETFDQRSGGDEWHFVAEVPLSPNNTNYVRIYCQGGAPCIADALHLRSRARYNDGSAARQVTLQPLDGIILARSIQSDSYLPIVLRSSQSLYFTDRASRH